VDQHVGKSPEPTGKLGGMKVEVVKGDSIEVDLLADLPESQSSSSHSVQSDSGTGNIQLRREAHYAGLPSRDRLVGKAGRPKDDIRFGIFGTKKMSTGYKDLLGKLDVYHSKYALNYEGTLSPESQLEQLDEYLGHLSSSVDKYLKGTGSGIGKSHTDTTRNQEIKNLKTQITEEKQGVAAATWQWCLQHGLSDELQRRHCGSFQAAFASGPHSDEAGRDRLGCWKDRNRSLQSAHGDAESGDHSAGR